MALLDVLRALMHQVFVNKVLNEGLLGSSLHKTF
jgi:hypothetical protein